MRSLALFALLLVGCPAAPEDPPTPPVSRPSGPTVLMQFDGPGFFDAPFPSEHRRVDGRVALDGFPVLEPTTPFVQKLLGLVQGTLPGFGTTSGIFLRLSASPQALPSLAETLEPASPLFLMGLDGPDAGVRVPVSVDFQPDGGPYGAVRLLSLLPLQGRPLAPLATYAAVVLRSLPVEGGPLGQGEELWELIQGRDAGLSNEAAAAYRDALASLAADGVGPEEIAGLAVFRTQDPTAELREATAAMREAEDLPVPQLPWALTDVYEGYCVFRSEVEMPVLQTGEPPFSGEGGAWAWTADGTPAIVAWERSRIDVTVPRGPMPEDGFPTAVFIRTGGGADRALIDRGVRDADGVAVPGTGIARELAAIGWAGIEVDGPHGGPRNVSDSDEQFLMFNMTNPVAMRDNVRQSALELSLLPPALPGLEFDASACPDGPGALELDGETLALLGHSMGATIAPLVLGVAPEFKAVALSGAGGSWIANVVHKRSPLLVRPLADSIVGYTAIGRTLHMHDPLLSLLQWGGESADPPVYARLAGARSERPVHALMVQGILDTYILPPMANATSLSFGWELAGEALDASDPRLSEFAPWDEGAALLGLSHRDLPASGNLPGGGTGIVVQYTQDPLEDGHEVFFQLDGPKVQLQAFLSAVAAGEVPPVP